VLLAQSVQDATGFDRHGANLGRAGQAEKNDPYSLCTRRLNPSRQIANGPPQSAAPFHPLWSPLTQPFTADFHCGTPIALLHCGIHIGGMRSLPPVPTHCLHCGVKYKVVRVEAPPSEQDREATC
jgi:hypothetical protein